MTEDTFEDAIESDDMHHISEVIPDVYAVYSAETVVLEDSLDDFRESSDTSIPIPHATSNVHVASSVMTSNATVTEDEYVEAVDSEATLHNNPATSHDRLVESTDDDDWDEPREAQNLEGNLEFDRSPTLSDEVESEFEPITRNLVQQDRDAQQESAGTTSMIDDVENLVADRLSNITQESHAISAPDQEGDISRISAADDCINIITQGPHVMSLPDQDDEIHQVDHVTLQEDDIHRISADAGRLSDATQESQVVSAPERDIETPLHSESLCETIEEPLQRMPEDRREIQYSTVYTTNQPHKSHDLEQTEGEQPSEENDFRESVVSDHDVRESTSTDTITVEDDEPIETKSTVAQEPLDEAQNVEVMEVDANESSSANGDNEVSLPTLLIPDDTVFVSPPPAPISHPVVYGTLNPMNENDDSDDSDEENEMETMNGVPPPLNLPVSDDEDEELEVDQSVADAIELESEKRKAKTDGLKEVEEPSLVKAIASAVAQNSGNDEIGIAFESETRAPHAVGFDSPPMSVHTKEPGDSDVFGIGYQNIKPRRQSTFGKQPTTSEYTLPKNSTFPDEKEFENECELTTDIQFSVKKERRVIDLSTAAISMEMQDGEDDDDEFGPTITAVSDVDISTELLVSKRASFEARIASEQVALVQELKTKTEQEHQQIVMDVQEGQPDIVDSSQKKDVEPALSVKELHSMYKRGLGDQSVLMMDDAPKKAPSTSSEGNSSENEPSRLSVMGRILSKKSVMSQAITEEDGEDEIDDDEGQDETQNEVGEDQESTRADREMLIDYTEAQNDRDSSGSVDEWQEIELMQAKKRTEADAHKPESGAGTPTADDSFMISFPEAAEYFSTADEFLLQLDRIVVEDEGSPTKTSCFTCFARPRLAFAGANEERDRVFCIAATAYDPGNVIFVRTLQTIYCRFTSTVREVSLSGSHWESIGFQGNDPSTDLRGCGVLSLLQMLYLVENHTELARRFFRLAQHPLRHFPLACTLINVTLQCIVALRSGALFRECNKQNSIMNAINLV